jgi:aryl-alcohol dehydrogenase-like predicted oxidoreductase
MERRRLGRTEHESSVAVLGGAAFWDASEEQAEEGFALALSAGVNHLDVAPQYGRAEAVLGPMVAAHRAELFVACKTLRHNADGVRSQLEVSLERLGCDSFDLYQLHAVTDLSELDRRADAVQAILRAREEGLCRFIGITGHNLTTAATQLEALRRYDLDTVMLPLNPRVMADPGYRDDVEALLELAQARDVGVMAIKAGAARPWASAERFATTWYEPYTTEEDLRRGISFALSLPGVAACCTPGDLDVLAVALRAASAAKPLDPRERHAASDLVAHEPSIFPMPS